LHGLRKTGSQQQENKYNGFHKVTGINSVKKIIVIRKTTKNRNHIKQLSGLLEQARLLQISCMLIFALLLYKFI